MFCLVRAIFNGIALYLLTPLPFLAYTTSMSNRRAHGPAIRAIREALGITQDSLALSCDISPSYLSRIESGAKQPSEALLTALAGRLGVTKDAISYSLVGAAA